jgi:aspartate dehydrogenase
MTPQILLIGYGAIAGEVKRAATETGLFSIGAVLVRPGRREAVQRDLDVPVIGDLSELQFRPALAAECASHEAVRAYGPALLRQGIDVVVTSIGALSDDALYGELEAAARQGGAQLILPAGAVPGIDAISAARFGGLETVSYTSRKPPGAWKGTPAEQAVDLDTLREAFVHYTGSARAAARDYPKNANVAATVALAGLGFDRTEVRMIADPGVSENIHEISVRGGFGVMDLVIKGRPLPSNPKTSSLAAYSAIRAIVNALGPIVI